MVALAPQFAALALLCSVALAAPQPRPLPQAHTHHVRSLANGRIVQSYNPEPVFETFGQGVENPLGKRADFRSAGLAFLGSRLGSNKFALKSSSEVDAVSNIYVSQSFNNIPVANAVANVALKGGNVVSWGNSFVKASSKVASPVAKISVKDAISTAEEFFNGKVRSSVAPKLEYYAVDSGAVVLTHVLQLQLENSIVEAFINAETGKVEGIIDFTANLTYDVIPVTEGSPLDGFKTLVDPEDLIASPEGWDTWNGTRTHVTRGNAVFAFKGSSTSFSAETSPDTYAYQWVPSAQPSVGSNVGKAVTNAFYLINSLHDILYRYGFTESAFNFQQNNFGKGGLGNDAVSISVQDPSGTNNAGMSTLPDGQTSFIQMYRFTVTTPNRDGSLQNDIVTHEFTHGVSNRLTGGGTARCLSTTEARGMGEGWSDSLANFMQQSSGTVQDWATGTYVLNSTAGVRDFIYSTDITKNPLTYADLRTRTAVHSAGVVWANFNHNVLDALIKAHGFAQDALTNPDGDAGNQVYLHLFIDHLAIQPCNPTVVQARAAWIQADINRYNGAHVCLLWKVFASRGLGVNATTTKTNNFDIPAECEVVDEPSTSETATTTSDAETTTTPDVSTTSTEVPTTSDVPTTTSEETPVETSIA